MFWGNLTLRTFWAIISDPAVTTLINLSTVKGKLSAKYLLIFSVMFFAIIPLLLGLSSRYNHFNNQEKNNAQILLAAKRNKKFQPSPSPSTAPSPSPSLTSSTQPITRQINVGVVVNDYANRTGELSALETQLGKPISTVSIYKQFGSKYNSNLVLDDLTYAKSQGMKLLIAWEPWNPEQNISQSIDYLKEISEGKHDTYIRSFANSVKTYANPMAIRFGHEMNGNWYPWGNRPTEYIAGYRHIVNIFKQEGVTNVTWMWSVNLESIPTAPISNVSSYYPGNDVVDVIGIDGYNWGTSQSWSNWKSFKDIFTPAYNFLTTSYAKPIVISETSSTEIGGDKPLWIQTMFKDDLTNTFPRIIEIIWFDILKETDWRINSSDASLQSFKNNMP